MQETSAKWVHLVVFWLKESNIHCHFHTTFYETLSGDVVKLAKGSHNNVSELFSLNVVLNDNVISHIIVNDKACNISII